MIRRVALAILLLVLLCAPAALGADFNCSVLDKAEIFSPEQITQINKMIDEHRGETKVRLLVLTFKESGLKGKTLEELQKEVLEKRKKAPDSLNQRDYHILIEKDPKAAQTSSEREQIPNLDVKIIDKYRLTQMEGPHIAIIVLYEKENLVRIR